MPLVQTECRSLRPPRRARAVAVSFVVATGVLLGSPSGWAAMHTPPTRCATSSSPASWCAYEERFNSWRRDLAARVDASSSARLAGLPPRLPHTLRRSESCLLTEAELKSCHRVIVSWRNALESWLGRNGVAGGKTLALPKAPRWESAPQPAGDLTTTLASLFRLTADARARPEARRTVSMSFDAPLSRAAALRLAVGMGASRDIDLIGTFVGSESVVTAGLAGREARTTVPLTTSIAGQIDSLYRDQLQSTTELRSDLLAGSADARRDRRLARAVVDLARYRTMLRRRDPFVSGFIAEVDVPRVVAAMVATKSRIASLIVPEPGARPVTPTLRVTVREHADVQHNARVAAAPRAAAPLAASAYMPSSWLARTFPTGAPNRYGHHVKQTNLLFRWKGASRLAYYQAGAAGQRGFEAQARPYTGTPWSTNWWVSGSWSSNMPSAYQDDLTSDGGHPVFAIGSANARALRANAAYWAVY